MVNDAVVLVVEDNVSNFVLIARMLGFLGIHCEWKTSGYEVVEYADTLPKVDLILMDIRLPYEDGYSALRKIRLSDRLKAVPVIAVTAEGGQEQIDCRPRDPGGAGAAGPVDVGCLDRRVADPLVGAVPPARPDTVERHDGVLRRDRMTLAERDRNVLAVHDDVDERIDR